MFHLNLKNRNAHSDLFQAEDAVCLSDYCDIMRCDVLLTQDPKTVYPDTINTDIEVWREAAAYKKALVSSGPRDVAKYSAKNGLRRLQKSKESTRERCKKSEAPGQLNTNGF